MHLKRNVTPIWPLMCRHVDAVCLVLLPISGGRELFYRAGGPQKRNQHSPNLCSLSSPEVPPRFLNCARTPKDAAPELGGHMGKQSRGCAPPPSSDMFSDLNMKSSPCQLSELLFVTLKNKVKWHSGCLLNLTGVFVCVVLRCASPAESR